jgi:hypothetical protein
MGLVAESMNPTHSVNEPALDEVDIVSLSPLKALFEIPVGGIKGIRVKTNFHI